MPPPLRKFGIGLGLFCAAAILGWAYLAARERYWVTVVIALGSFAASLMLVGIVVSATSVSPRAEITGTGTLLKPDPRIEKTLLLMTATGAIASWAALFASFPYGAFYIPLFSELPESFFVLPILSLGAALALTYVLWGFTRRGISSILLTPDGVRFPSARRAQALKWDDIAEVRDVLPTGEGRVWTPMVLMTTDGSYMPFESPGIYTPGGTALVELVRFYWQNSAQRFELTDGRAVRRLMELHESQS